MTALLEVAELGLKATRCTAYGEHRPEPLRFVLHHIRPQAAGGLTVRDNLAEVCDTCHVAAHALLFYAAQHDGQLPPHRGTRGQRALALTGYRAAAAAGTVSLIPNEGAVAL